MNALVNYRANSVGQLTATPSQRSAAVQEITSNLRAKLQGMLRKASEDKGLQTTSTQTQKADSSESLIPEEELGRDTFLNLLVMELQHQDPLDPVNNRDMIAQLAQFSSLEQANELNDNFAALSDRFEYFSGNLDQLNFISAQGLLGKYVEGVDTSGTTITGKVESVQLSGSIVVLTVDGQRLPMTGVTTVGTEAPEPPTEDAG